MPITVDACRYEHLYGCGLASGTFTSPLLQWPTHVGITGPRFEYVDTSAESLEAATATNTVVPELNILIRQLSLFANLMVLVHAEKQ